MPIVSVRIPQIGEGLQEARLVAVLKNPGDTVKRDEPIYQMETDKAVMDVESPYEGVLVGWSAAVDTILPIGDEVATMEVADGVTEVPAAHGSPGAATTATATAPAAAAASSGSRRLDVPPRSRAYAKEKGLSDADLEGIPAAGSKLMPSDIDAFLSGGGAPAPAATSDAFVEVPMGQKQRLLSSRLVRGSQLVVPGTITVACRWGAIEQRRSAYKSSGGDFQPSAFTLFAFAVAQALKHHPALRSTMIGDATIRTYHHANLGIAVALPGDELVMAVVEDADALPWRDFANRTRERIETARGGQDQATEALTISLTNMQAFGLRDAVPVVVPPAVATLFLGEPYNGLDQDSNEPRLMRYVNLALTFDHRMMNGVGAAEFLNAVKQNVEGIDALVGE
ncbi:MAG: Dihydrolipoyllysine-residue acetyltransferase component of pyruvate dehydrogenase complex [Fimbriimonadaceae bacterium]|nr:Dihydrolipoyllysine-residue acetyltransferase component of pyruvate dehydrogenase complex [Fimbriimonadaceae bacterium]